jgi:hypothetical protein
MQGVRREGGAARRSPARSAPRRGAAWSVVIEPDEKQLQEAIKDIGRN